MSSTHSFSSCVFDAYRSIQASLITKPRETYPNNLFDPRQPPQLIISPTVGTQISFSNFSLYFLVFAECVVFCFFGYLSFLVFVFRCLQAQKHRLIFLLHACHVYFFISPFFGKYTLLLILATLIRSPLTHAKLSFPRLFSSLAHPFNPLIEYQDGILANGIPGEHV